MREIRVHAASGDDARTDGAAALGVGPAEVHVEILDSDEHGVTARVYVPVVADVVAPAAGEEPRDESAGEPPEEGEEAAVEGDRAPRQPQSDLGATAHGHLEKILAMMAVEAVVELIDESEDEVTLNIEGDDLGVVIGSFGQTLNALQFLLNLMISRRGRRRRITVDAGGYRERRRARLEEIALEHARRAKEERRGVILEGLRAAERRIIHTTLQNDPDVVTFSEGEEPHRRLVISPRTSNS